jgi:hypothetical protein
MGIFSWITFLVLLGISGTYMYFIFRISERILQVQERYRKTGDQVPQTPLIITGSLALLGIVMTFIYNLPQGALGRNGKIIQLVVYISGIVLYISSFITMFFIGRSYSLPGFPKKAMTPFQVSIGMTAAFLPFFLLIVLGKFVVSGGMTRDSRMNPGDIAEFGLLIVLLMLPSISGVFGAGVFGKHSLQN